MRKIVLFAVLILVMAACKKIDKEPEGPTDIRVRNLTTAVMNDLTVDTSGGENNYGTVEGGGTTEYFRFEKAYPKANISAIINGQKYKTDTAIYTWMQYLGVVKATYEIYIVSDVEKKLAISNVIMESSLEE